MNNRPVELEVKHLCKYYKAGKKRVLKAVDDVSFVIHKGETLGIVGESGCGKTTCGKTCIGMLDRTSGEVFYQGKNVHQMSKKERFDFSGKVQMIFQDPYASLDPHQKVYNIVAEGIRIHKLAKTQAEEERMVLELLDMVGLNAEHAMRNVHEFSGGQRQRLGIARALIMEPEFIIADEPISALDVSIRAQIINLLNELKKEHSLTYLFIAHDLSVVRFISDRIGVIYKGALMELAPGEEIFAHPLHPYTRSLLSAIPMPDPAAERGKTCTPYNPSVHDYSVDKPVWTEIAPGHFVFANARECDEYRRMLG